MNNTSLYFGDLHVHTSLSDGRAEPSDAFAAGRAHLDFIALGDHAQFPDLPWVDDQTNRGLAGWPEAVPREKERWHDVQTLVRQHYVPGEFAPFLGYEWTSQRWGDHNVYYLRDDEPIRYAKSLHELYDSLANVEAIVIPHHTSYPTGHRGIDWDCFDCRKSPLVEIYSCHGSSETDTGYYPLFGAMGPGCTAGTARRGLDAGHIFGFAASSDGHSGFPGRYGTGLVAVRAEALTRPALWEAFQERRTYAVTGDRVSLDFRLNELPMGSIVHTRSEEPSRLVVEVDGWDCLSHVEIIKNGDVVKRWNDFDFTSIRNGRRFKARIVWGSGAPGATPGEKRWDFSVEVRNGTIAGHQPCFQPPGLHQVTGVDSRQLDVTSRTGAGVLMPRQEVCLDLRGTPATCITLLHEGRSVLAGSIGELMNESRSVCPFGPYRGSYYLSRVVAEPHFHRELEWEDGVPGGNRDYYYARVLQKNRQMAWSSPIWTVSGHALQS